MAKLVKAHTDNVEILGSTPSTSTKITKMNPGTLIHYGSARFSNSKWEVIQNKGSIKPLGGLWTSPINSTHSWKHWCHRERFRRCRKHESFTLSLKENARIYIIDSCLDIDKMPVLKQGEDWFILSKIMCRPDFEELSKNYDAIWLTERGERTTRYPYLGDRLSFYGWDCETVLILNKEVIILHKSKGTSIWKVMMAKYLPFL